LLEMGLDFERIHALNERIILASTSAFGDDGPYANRPGFDGVGQAMSGAMHLTGTDGEPRKAFAHYVDHLTATLSAFGIMAALRMRDCSGQGQQVKTSLLGTALLTMAGNLLEESILRLDRPGTGNRAQLAAPADVFAAADGYVLLQTVGTSMFRRCARLLRREDWLLDEGLGDDAARGRRGEELSAVVAAWCASRSVEECLQAFASAGLPAAPVLSPRQALRHPAIAHGNFWSPGDLPLTKIPVSLSDHDLPDARPAPQLGADTAAILAELSLGAIEIANLRSTGAIR
jgi:crotonobetainyl-CoA:carnitine CoA-transferase CaiB-like acyl-CoA transferase